MGFVTKEKFLSKDFFINYAWLLGGCFVFALGAVLFAEPYGFAPGGTYGLSMVFHHLWGWETEVAALCMDVPLLLLGIYFLGGMFGVKTIVCTFAIPAFMRLIHYFYGYDALLEPGITTTPFCRFQRRISCAEDFLCACAISEITSLPRSFSVYSLPPRGYHPCTTMPRS